MPQKCEVVLVISLNKYLCFSRKCIGAIIYFRKMKQDYLIFITFVFLKKEAK